MTSALGSAQREIRSSYYDDTISRTIEKTPGHRKHFDQAPGSPDLKHPGFTDHAEDKNRVALNFLYVHPNVRILDVSSPQ